MLAPLIVECVQQEEAHCGPATIEMLFSFYGINVSQTAISKAAGMADVIRIAQGMRLDELNTAIDALYPERDYVLLAKYHSCLDDVIEIIDGLRLPIGVEWQGRFARPDGTEYDQGHYSVLTALDQDRRLLYIADPEDHDLLTPEGVIDLDLFMNRWWEVDIVPLPDHSGNTRVIEMDSLIFALVPQDRKMGLLKRGFRTPTLAMIWDNCTPLEPVE
jgi:ABC-type bacteriocin/lantibiotic exporter with double-glycine peptidase domain